MATRLPVQNPNQSGGRPAASHTLQVIPASIHSGQMPPSGQNGSLRGQLSITCNSYSPPRSQDILRTDVLSILAARIQDVPLSRVSINPGAKVFSQVRRIISSIKLPSSRTLHFVLQRCFSDTKPCSHPTAVNRTEIFLFLSCKYNQQVILKTKTPLSWCFHPLAAAHAASTGKQQGCRMKLGVM